MKRVGIGIVGLGLAVKPHALALKDLSAKVDVIGGFSPTASRRAAFAHTWGLPVVDHLAALLDNPRVDAVMILTPPRAHVELAIAAARAGKHVLLEKPVDVDLPRARALVEAVEHCDRKLGVVFQHRFRPGSLALRELLQKGALGDLLSVSASVRWWRPPEYFAQPGRGMKARDGGGVLLSQAIHTLDLLLDLVGPVRTVLAACRTSPLRAGALILREQVTSGMVTGGALILAGVAIAQFGDSLRLSGRLAALAAVLFAVTMWGLIPVAMRYLVTELSPETAMVLRLYPAGLLAIIVVIFMGVRRIAWRDWGRIAIASLAGNLGYQILAAYGMESVPASWTGLIFGLEPVFIALFAVLLAGDRLTPWLIAGIFVAMLGTAALMLGSSLMPAGGVSLFGIMLVTLSTMGWGIYTVVIRPVANKYGAVPVACLAMAISALPMPFFAGVDFPETLRSMDATAWTAVGFVVVFGTFLATSAWNYALGHMESSIAGVFLYVQPVVAAAGGILLLGESLTWPLVLGGALIICGVAIAQFGPLMRRTRLRAPAAAAMEAP